MPADRGWRGLRELPRRHSQALKTASCRQRCNAESGGGGWGEDVRGLDRCRQRSETVTRTQP